MLIEVDTSASKRIQAEIDALDAEKARTDEAFLKSLVDLRAALNQRYGTEMAPDSSRG